MVGELTTSLIHDLKNPLLVVQLAADLLRKPNLGLSDHEKYCTVIEQQIRRITGMSQEIMEFVRGDSNLSVQETNLRELILDLIGTYAEPFANDGITLSLDIGNSKDDDLIVPVDADKLARALLNLVNNARDAVTAGGKISVSIKSLNDQVKIAVSDTGAGIPDEIKETIFEPFVTHGKSCGTGLGLAIVKRIIDAHGGGISFESTLSVGTTFNITLPRRSPVQPATADLGKSHAMMA
ncbi:MAG: HAMP domain-containing sensor histidine kinase [Candidatus Zixiibacteriota bacterium]